MTLAASLTDLVVAAPLAFLLGVAVGLVLSSRYRITKVNGK